MLLYITRNIVMFFFPLIPHREDLSHLEILNTFLCTIYFIMNAISSVEFALHFSVKSDGLLM